MKTHSGSFWLDLGDRLSLLLGAWGALFGISMALKSANEGNLGLFAMWGGVAVVLGWVFAVETTRQLDHAAEIAVADHRIEELRLDNEPLNRAMVRTVDHLGRPLTAHVIADGGTP